MIAAVVQARFTSTRLPGKALLPVVGEPMLWRQLERVQRASKLEIVLATSNEASDDGIAALAEEHGVRCHRGSLNDVLVRMRDAAASIGAEHVVRLTGDCPLSDPDVIDAVVREHLASGCDYTSNVLERSYPDGLDVEVVRFECLDRAAREASEPLEREHVTPFFYTRPSEFRMGHVQYERDLSALRWVVDESADYSFVCAVFEKLLPRGSGFGLEDVLKLLDEHPEIAELNAAHSGAASWPSEVARALVSEERG